MSAEHLDDRRTRARRALIIVGLGLALLLVVFFRLQVVDNPLRSGSDGRLHASLVPAPRGLILDRHGARLAETIPSYTVAIAPPSVDSARRALERLAPHLGLSEAGVQQLLDREARWHGQRVVLARDVPQDVAAALLERRGDLRDVEVEVRAARHYPGGRAVAHVVGVVGPSTGSKRAEAENRWTQERLVGVLGAERLYDAKLSAVDGVEYLRDEGSSGRSPVQLAREVRAVPGRPLRLTVDLELQELAAITIPADVRAAVVALDPATGEVLVLYSSPSFDPDHVSGPAFGERWGELAHSEPGAQLARPVQAMYSPGSVWSVVTAAVARRLGVADAGTTMPLACRGGLSYGNRYLRCGGGRAHGTLDLGGALAAGCDVYFFQLGLQIGLDRLASEATALGLDQPTGLGLPDEAVSAFGSKTGWTEAASGASGLEAMLVGSGRGLVEVTPVRMAHLFASLLAERPVPAPRLDADLPSPSVGSSSQGMLAASDRQWLRAVLAPDGDSTEDGWRWRAVARTAPGGEGNAPEWFLGLAEGQDGDSAMVVAVVMETGDGTMASTLAGILAATHLAEAY